jgi:hypothetical protein
MPKDHEIFLSYLNETFGEEDTILQHEPADGGPKVSVFVYKNLPEPGMITGVTYGLSWHSHPDWKLSRPELIVSMESLDTAWPFSAAYFAGEFRGSKRFSYGDVFTMDDPIADDTEMNGFFLFAQIILDANPPHLKLNRFDISFSQLYPIYSSELPLYRGLGLEAFWKHPDFEIYNPNRKPIKA